MYLIHRYQESGAQFRRQKNLTHKLIKTLKKMFILAVELV